MKKIGDVNALQGLSTPKNTSGANTPPSSGAENECPDCLGAGFVRMDAPVGHLNFGRLIPCECKILERENRRRRDYLEMSSLAPFEDWTFETFDPNIQGVHSAFEVCVQYAQNPTGWLYLVGGYGCGKTHLAAAVANYAMAHQRMYPLFCVVPDLLDHLRAAYAPDQGSTYDDRFQKIRAADLLILDDLGTENTTPWAREKLFQVINFRYNEQRPTVITSNRNMDELDGRIASRLADARICQGIIITSGDYRVRGSRLPRR